MNEKKDSILVAITGGSGSGKSWLADRLQWLLGELAGRISMDDFYRDHPHLPLSYRSKLNFDEPEAIEWPLFESVLLDSMKGKDVLLPQYDFCSHSRCHKVKVCPARPIILVDGLWLLHHPGIRKLFKLRIYMHCSQEVRLQRRIERDIAQRSRMAADVCREFRNTVVPLHEMYVSPQMKDADLILYEDWDYADIRHVLESLVKLAGTENASLPKGAEEIFAGVQNSTRREVLV